MVGWDGMEDDIRDAPSITGAGYGGLELYLHSRVSDIRWTMLAIHSKTLGPPPPSPSSDRPV